MMDQDEQLRSFARWRTKSKRDNTTSLAEAVNQLMEDWISPQQAKFESVDRLWSQLLPVELRRHCKLADTSTGRLKVLVDSPTYLHELRLCSSELLKQLQLNCPKARIKEIKFVVG